MRYASTFLSHSSRDTDLVEAVAVELGRRGVLAWLDKGELHLGQDLSLRLAEAIRERATLTAFISAAALESAWVNQELVVALDKYENEGREDLIVPVYLEDSLALLRSSRVLAQRWLHPERDRVKKLGVSIPPGLSLEAASVAIVDRVADAVFRGIDSAGAGNVMIHLDQRGSMRRGVPPSIPRNHVDIDGAGLIFRPRRGYGQQSETIVGDEWQSLAETMTRSLAGALGGVRWADGKTVYLSGQAQLGLAYLFGHYFNRSTHAILHCTDVATGSFSNAGWDRTDILRGGRADCEANARVGLPPLPGGPIPEAIVVVSRENRLQDALPHLASTKAGVPIAWVATPQLLEDSEGVRALIADVTALLRRLVQSHQCGKVYLLLGLPLIAVPLLAAHLVYVAPRITLLEYRRDRVEAGASADEFYSELKMPLR